MSLELFDNYRKLVERDLTFDRFKIQELSQMLPGKKHFWVGKLIECKIQLKKLEDKKKELMEQARTNFKPEIGMSSATINNLVQNSDVIKDINRSIDEYKIIIEYLDHVTKIFYQCGYDLKNFIETLKLEEVK